MKGVEDKDGMIVITFNPATEILHSCLLGKKYMPCQRCGLISSVDLNVLKFYCVNCIPMKPKD